MSRTVLPAASLWRARLGRQRLAAAVALAALPVGLYGGALQGAGAGLSYMVAGFGLFTGAWVTLGYLLAPTHGKVVIDEEHVRCGTETLERSAIHGGYYAPAAGKLPGSVVLLDAKNRHLGKIGVADHAEADRVLTALHIGAERVTARFDGMAPAGTRGARSANIGISVGLLVLLASFPLHLPTLGLAAFVLGLAATVLLNGTRFHVGADGVRLDNSFGSRFVPWADVTEVEASPRGVLLKLRSGSLELPLTRRRNVTRPYEYGFQRAFLTRVTDAFAAYRRGVVPDASARVARGGRTREAWMRDLFARDGSFRAAPLRDEQLWQVVESAGAMTSARAGAAVVLGRTGSDEDRSRLRVAAAACASPRLRVVLEKTASGAPEPEVEEALGALEDAADRDAALRR